MMELMQARVKLDNQQYSSVGAGHFLMTYDGVCRSKAFTVRFEQVLGTRQVLGLFSTDTKQQVMQVPLSVYALFTPADIFAMCRTFVLDYQVNGT